MPRKKKSHKPKVNKSAFVRDLPATLSAAEVVQKAKGAGITITDKHVYVIRSKAKVAKAGRSASRRGRPPKVTTAKTKSLATGRASSLAVQFVDAALDLGLARAEGLLASLRGKLKHVIG
jgi:hypothetical protein